MTVTAVSIKHLIYFLPALFITASRKTCEEGEEVLPLPHVPQLRATEG